MKIFINHQSLHQQSSSRGIGVYTRELLTALQQTYTHDEFVTKYDPRNPPDLIHYPYFDPFAPTLKLVPTIPTVITIHDLIPLRFPSHFPVGLRGKFNWFRQSRRAKQVSHIITDSESSKKDIIKILGLSGDKVTVVPLGPNQTKKLGAVMSGKIASSYALPPKYLLYVGDINWNKNVTGLIRAFSELKDKNLYLVLVGKVFSDQPDIPEYREIQRAIEKSGKKDLIIPLGFVPSHHLSVLYARALLYVQPSWYEGFGLPILEAMKFGCPVASSSRGSLPEIGGEAVAYFDPAKNMTETIADLISSPARLKELSVLGASRAKEFTWTKTALLTHEVYENILSPRA